LNKYRIDIDFIPINIRKRAVLTGEREFSAQLREKEAAPGKNCDLIFI
jgi:hypothetical protein